MKMKQRGLQKLAACLFAGVLLFCAVPALADDEVALPDWASEISVAGESLADDSSWQAHNGYWTTSEVGVPGIAAVSLYDSGTVDIVITGDVTLSGAPLVDVGNASGLYVNINIDLGSAEKGIAITRADDGPALSVSDASASGVDQSILLVAGASGEEECLIDKIDIHDGATLQVVYQEQLAGKSAHLRIGEALGVAEGASFNTWAIGNSHLTVLTDAQATVKNQGTIIIGASEFDNAGTFHNTGKLSLQTSGFNNSGTVENDGTLELLTSRLVNSQLFENDGSVTVGNASTFENAHGTVNNGADGEDATLAISDGGRFVNDAESILENHAPVTLDGRASFENDDPADTDCTYHCFSTDAVPTYTTPVTCYVCEQAVYEADTVAPKGRLSVNGVSYSDLEAISQTHAVNPGAPVTLSAEDDESGLKRISYVVRDHALTADEVAAIDDWQLISLDEATEATLSIGPDPVQDVADVSRFAVYVRLEDNAGHDTEGSGDNVTYIGTPLFTIDKSAPVVDGITDGGHYTGDVAFTVSDADGEAVTVTLDGTPLEADENGSYMIKADNKSHTVVVTSGTHTLTYTVTVDEPPVEEPDDPEPDRPVIVLNKIHALEAEGGTLTLSQSFAAPGRTIEVTALADDGYTLSSVQARDENGEALSLKETADGHYTFTMPAEDVTVEAQFTKNATDPDEPRPFPFTDVHPDDWFYEDVYTAWEKGLVGGMTETLYMPQTAMTRAMTVTILSRFEDEIPTVPGAWYESARQWAMETGISDGTNMEANISRQQLATMLWRYAWVHGWDISAAGDLSAFKDASEISAYAHDAMVWATGAGILGGKGDGILDPQGNATRAEFAAMINRFSKLYDL